MPEKYSIKQCEIIYNEDYISRKKEQGLMLPSTLQAAAIKRKCEFLAGRYCAQQAMKELGVMNPIQPSIGKYREPLWPQGITGSISHHKHIAIAIATDRKINGLGIDIETWIPVDTADKIYQLIVDNVELSMRPLSWSLSAYLTIIFSAKESLFKALFNQINQYIDFHDIRLTEINFSENKLSLTLNRTLTSRLTKGLCFVSSMEISQIGVKTIVCLD